MRKITTLILFLLLAISPMAALNVGKPFFRNYPALEYNGHNRNFTLESDGRGRLFVANFEGLIVYDGFGWKMIHTPAISRVTSLYLTSDGVLWLGGDDLIGYMKPEESYDITYVASDAVRDVSFGEVSRIFELEGSVYFTTGSEETYVVKDGKVELYRKDDSILFESGLLGLQGADINDRENIADLGLTAIATTNRGVVILDQNSRELYSLDGDDGLCSNTVQALAYDGKGSLWGATDNGLFAIRLSAVFTHYSESDGLVGQVTSILKTNDNLYVGTLQGLFSLNENDRFDRVSGVELACWQLGAFGDQGAVIAATAEGVFLLGNTVKQLTTRHTLCGVNGSNDSFLTGELDGIYYHTVSGEDKLVAQIPNVVKLVPDEDGGMWAITLSKDTYYKAADSNTFELRENSDLTLLFQYTDPEGRVWHSDADNTGLRNDALGEGEKKWLEPFSGYNIQAMDLRDGIAWVGGSFGLIRMDLKRAASQQAYEPQIYLRSFVRDDDNISFVITSDKTDPIGSTKYSYRLNDDAPWTRWSENQEYDFSHLSSGTYLLKARLIDAFGNISESDTIRFVVPTPIYMKWYAIIFYVILVLLLAYFIFRLRIKQAQEEQAKLEKTVNERTQQLKDAQSQLIRQEREATVGKLTKGLIDRILNPMNYINNFSHLTIGLTKDMRENLEDDEEKMTEDVFEDCMDVLDMMNTNLSKIEQHGMSTTRILKAMEELLKERSGNVERVNLNTMCQKCVEVFNNYFAADISRMNMTVRFEASEQPAEAMVVADHFSKAVNYMLSNSVYAVRKKFEKEGASYNPEIRLTVKAPAGNDGPVISVYDNGIGIEDSIKDKIFDPFFTTKPTAEAPGIGLYLGQQIIQDVNGTITFNSNKDEFTEFDINLPKI